MRCGEPDPVSNDKGVLPSMLVSIPSLPILGFFKGIPSPFPFRSQPRCVCLRPLGRYVPVGFQSHSERNPGVTSVHKVERREPVACVLGVIVSELTRSEVLIPVVLVG